MSVNVIWSNDSGGDPIVSTVNHGNSSNGASTAVKTIHIRHDGANPITDAGFYIRQFSGTYTGSRTPAADLAEILGWGDSVIEADFGGLQINQNKSGGFPGSSYSTFAIKEPTAGNVFRTGEGDSEGNNIPLRVETGLSPAIEGQLQAGNSPNVAFQLRFSVPANEDTLGVRQVEQVIVFNFTS